MSGLSNGEIGGFSSAHPGGTVINLGEILSWNGPIGQDAILLLGASNSAGRVTLASPVRPNGVDRRIMTEDGAAPVDAEILSPFATWGGLEGAGWSMVKLGSGVLALSGGGANLRGRDATNRVDAGTLLCNAIDTTLGAGMISVSSNAWLGGGGVTGDGNVSISPGGGLAPGSLGVGTLTIGSSQGNADLTAAGMVYEWEWENGAHDRVHVKGNLTFNAGTYDLKLLNRGGTAISSLVCADDLAAAAWRRKRSL